MRRLLLVLALLLLPSVASGQVYITAPGVTCANDPRLTAPVIGRSICYDATKNEWFAWTGQWSQLTTTGAAVSVKDYGAKGDGVTDDTTAIQNAINAFGTGTTNPGGTIFFPQGKYIVSSTLTLPVNVQLVGVNTATDATKASAVYYTSVSAATCALSYPGTINAEAYVKLQIRDLQIALNSTTTYAICLTGAADIAIDRVYIEGGLGGTNRGIYCQDCLFMRVTRSHFNRMQYGIVSDEIFNANYIDGNQFIDMDQYAILLRGNVSAFNCCQGVWIANNHFIKVGASTYQGALHVIAPAQSITFENNSLEVMQSTAVASDRTDPIAGGGSGFVDGLSVRNNLFVAGVATNVVIDYTRFSTLGPNVNLNPAGGQPQFYFVSSNASNNVIPPGTQTASKLLISETGIVDTLVSDSGAGAFYTGIARTATDPTTTNWGDQNHAGRLWWNTAGTARLKLWDGANIMRPIIANDSTGATTVPGILTGQGVGPSVLFQPTTANNAEIWLRHGSVGTNSKFVSLSTGVLDIYTADTKVASFGNAGGYFTANATGASKGIDTINLGATTPIYVNGNPIFSTGTPTCGTGCATIVTNSMDSWGAMTVTAQTSATVNWSHTLNRAPFCTVSDNSTTLNPDVTSTSTTNMVIGISGSLTGTIYWNCGGAG